MKITVKPSCGRGVCVAPPSKSDSHRLLLAAGLAGGESIIENLAFSQDICATADCLQALGATLIREKDRVRVCGVDPTIRPAGALLPCRESGSTLRFMIPLCLMGQGTATLTGAPRLMERPLTVYEDLAAEKGWHMEHHGQTLQVEGPLTGGDYCLRGDISSQFFTGLLYALPLLAGDSRIRWITPLTSRPYIDMTLATLRRFGLQVEEEGASFFIPGGQSYRPGRLAVEGDYSNAAFLEALNLCGGSVEVTGLAPDSLQGDRVYRKHFERLKQGYGRVDLTDCPDLGPILFTVAALCHGACFTGTERLRIKESDRVAVMAGELAKCGVRMQVSNDRVEIAPGVAAPEVPLYGHNDHRVVMALTVLLSRVGGSLTGVEAVNKSFPDFFLRMKELKIEVTCDGVE